MQAVGLSNIFTREDTLIPFGLYSTRTALVINVQRSTVYQMDYKKHLETNKNLWFPARGSGELSRS
jgi:hypothetical protein